MTTMVEEKPVFEGLSLTLAWSPPPSPGSTLFIALAYRGRDRDNKKPNVWTGLESAANRGHRIVHRDFYANPRPFPYQVGMITAAARLMCGANDPDLAIDDGIAGNLPADIHDIFGTVERVSVTSPRDWETGILAASVRYDNIVLVFADALGLGCENIEKEARCRSGSVFVITGRRRAYRLAQIPRWRIRLSRFLAHTRIAEKVFAILVRPTAAALAACDRTRQRFHV